MNKKNFFKHQEKRTSTFTSLQHATRGPCQCNQKRKVHKGPTDCKGRIEIVFICKRHDCTYSKS